MVISNNIIDVSIIDDDPKLITLLDEQFSDVKGINLRWAGADITHFLQHGIQKTDILLLDIELENTSGADLIETLKSANPMMSIVMFTVVEDEDVLFTCISKGAAGYLLKDTSFDAVVATIHTTMNGGASISPMMARKLFQHFNRDTVDHFSASLSKSEYQVLKLLSEGLSYKLIAAKLDMSLDSVRYYIKGVYKKLQVNSKGEAINRFLSVT